MSNRAARLAPTPPLPMPIDLDPAKLSAQERYKILSGTITPRPIAFVSSRSPEGAANLAPYSFFNGMGVSPMMLVFSPLTMADGDKDTLRNVLPVDEGGTGEFVVNLVSEPMVRRMSVCAERLPHGESEFELSGLEEAPAAVVGAPRVKGAPLSFECKTWRVIRTNPGVPLSGNLVIGEVVHIWMEEGVADDELHFDADALRMVGRMGGPLYTRTRERFSLPRGPEALKAPLPFDPETGEDAREDG